MGALADLLGFVTASRAKPPSVPDTFPTRMRGGRDGSLYTQSLAPDRRALVEEGSYFSCTNPTPGTPIAYGAAGTQAAFSDTVAFMQIVNLAIPGDPDSPTVYPDFLKLIQIGGTAPATTTSVQFAARLDNGFRASTAGTPTVNTPWQNNGGLIKPAPNARVITYSGAVPTIPASVAASMRQPNRAQLKGGPTLVLDEHVITWGQVDGNPNGGYLTTVAGYNARVTPVGIAPGQSLSLHLWFPGGATNAFSYEFELGLEERA